MKHKHQKKNGRYKEYDDIIWYKDGKYHRDNDLPAYEEKEGTQAWYVHGKLHRENDSPAIIRANGTKEWFFNNVHHRDNNLPAIEYADGDKVWYVHGKLHRENGPAYESEEEGNEWWIENIQYSEEEFNNYLEKKKLNESLQNDLNHKNIKSQVKL